MRKPGAATVLALLIGAGVISMATPAGAATTGVSTATSSHTLTRPERDVLLVALTFILGAPLLTSEAGEDGSPPARPRISLYDDPNRIRQREPRRAREGKPPPLR